MGPLQPLLKIGVAAGSYSFPGDTLLHALGMGNVFQLHAPQNIPVTQNYSWQTLKFSQHVKFEITPIHICICFPPPRLIVDP